MSTEPRVAPDLYRRAYQRLLVNSHARLPAMVIVRDVGNGPIIVFSPTSMCSDASIIVKRFDAIRKGIAIVDRFPSNPFLVRCIQHIATIHPIE
jgi:hypothetical protein